MRTIYIFFTLLFFTQLGMAAVSTNLEADAYIQQYGDIAVQEMKRSGIPASIILAQAILSSENGTNEMAIDNNNHFATKCGLRWKGETHFSKTNGDISSTCYRAYTDAVNSYIDYTNLLMEEATCRHLFQFSYYDYKSWAEGLQKCIYQEDRKYAEKLVKIIKKYDLSKLDNPNSFSPPVHQNPIIGYEYEID